jgi:hypothetical protein
MNKQKLNELLHKNDEYYEQYQGFVGSSEEDAIEIEGHLFTVIRNERINNDVEFVFSLKEPSGEVTFWSELGYYNSYDGTNWDNSSFGQVKPREVTVIVYDSID